MDNKSASIRLVQLVVLCILTLTFLGIGQHRALAAASDDIAVVSVSTCKDVSIPCVSKNYTAHVYVTIQNIGTNPETPTVEAWAGSTLIGSTATPVASGATVTVTFVWSTASFSIGPYTIRGHSIPVTGETNTGDNELSTGVVYVTAVGEINVDHRVDGKDFVLMKSALGSVPSNPRYKPNADINDDHAITVADYQIIKTRIPSTW